MKKPLRKVNENYVSGVCGGVAYWLGIPATIVRVAWCLAIMCYGTGVLLYILFVIFMPEWKEDPEDYKEMCG